MRFTHKSSSPTHHDGITNASGSFSNHNQFLHRTFHNIFFIRPIRCRRPPKKLKCTLNKIYATPPIAPSRPPPPWPHPRRCPRPRWPRGVDVGSAGAGRGCAGHVVLLGAFPSQRSWLAALGAAGTRRCRWRWCWDARLLPAIRQRALRQR